MARTPLSDRVESLRVAMHNTELQPQILDNSVNVALQEDMPSSPDEQIIRQRGRRFSTNCRNSPMATPMRHPFQGTPTKIMQTSGMILRSSPRKRLTMGSTAPETAPINTVTLSPTKPQQWSDVMMPVAKRLRLGEAERPIAQMANDVPLTNILQILSKAQLIDIITASLNGDQKEEERLRASLPQPDMEPLQRELLHAKRNIFKGLPTSRLCKKTDSSAYARAAVHLAEFKRLISFHTKQLSDAFNWDALLDYVLMAWPVVRGTPLWDANYHNTIRRQCFKLLSYHTVAAIKNGGLRLGFNRLHHLEHNLTEWSEDCEDVLCCVNALNKTLNARSSL